ncbi:gliding motility protein [Anditalea andensis]|uniref:Gliding motility protein n=1 Tax=Anditalea andensis TaxID=1048983 RepID=A0A074KZM8_9BACT|nr:gliding motility protein [Anditalea andensis]
MLKYRNLVFYLAIYALASCSSERNTFTNRMYHNTTARYNAYYLALEKVEEVENTIRSSHEEDYAEVLPVFYPIDSAVIDQNEELLKDAYSMASKAIDWHKISKWVDDSYFLIGKIQHMRADFDDAINTFKFLNVNSKDDHVRHLALTQLLRAFIDLRKFDDAAFVIDYLSKENGISKENKQYLYLTLAYYYEVRGERDGILSALDKAVDLTTDPKEKSRINFILGQLYQRAGFDAFAYDYYQKALKGNPPYERAFFSQLYSQQVAELEKSKDFKNVRKYYDDLYQDSKNSELRSVILYEKAQFELKQQNRDEGIRLLTLAAKEDGGNIKQKGYIYNRLSELYFEDIKDFRSAKFYLDSAMGNFKETDRAYQTISRRKKVLDEYVVHYDLIQYNDSLIRLSGLTAEEQELIAENFIKGEEQRLINEAAQKNKQKSTGIFDNLLAFGGSKGSGSTFYFDNSTAMQQGSLEFYRVWGTRPLEDNWRRSSKGFQQAIGQTLEEEEAGIIIEDVTTQPDITLPSKEELLKNIPRDKSTIQQMKMEMEESYFQLGKVLFFDLKEAESAMGYLHSLLEQFPNSNRKPEVYYTLYLVAQEAGKPFEKYKASLNREFPDSQYTRSLNNPSQSSGAQGNRVSGDRYKEAYELFMTKNYLSSRSLINQTLKEYPLTKNTDKLLLLDIMNANHLDGKVVYKQKLETYINNVNDAQLEKLAKNMLSALTGDITMPPPISRIDSVGDSNLLVKDTINAAPEIIKEQLIYKENMGQTHIFILALNPQQVQETTNLTADLESFHNSGFSNARLRTGTISINKDNTLVIISPFSNAEKALDYRKKFLTEFNTEGLNAGQKSGSFVISIENFQQLNKRKDLEEYKDFYKEAYK